MMNPRSLVMTRFTSRSISKDVGACQLGNIDQQSFWLKSKYGAMPRQYPPQFRERALRLVEETLPAHETEFAAMKKVATKF
jgi:hypothetical protein